MVEGFIVGITLLIIFADIYFLVDKRYDTISSVIRDASFKYPIIPFSWGLLMGHWFW